MANEIVKQEQGTEYLISSEMSQIIAEEFKGLDVPLPKIKIPSGGGLAFEVPGDDAESPDMVKNFNAVILKHKTINVYYKDKYTGENTTPECYSEDGQFGKNKETGEVINCKECPLNEYGSGEGGSGKACQNKCVLYLLREGECIPTILTLPATSLKALNAYKVRLVSKGNLSNGIVTTFGLKKSESKDGIKYSEATFLAQRKLSVEEKESVAKIIKSLQSKEE